jgi:pimeloyl-ACP methyl ester carboxylesterase
VNERTCVVRGRSVAVHDSGERGAPVLLALHGYPDTGRIFARLSAALVAMRVVAPDWPGQGGSEPAAASFAPTERAAWLRDLLNVLGIEQCVVYGHDMGALPALAFARDHGPRVRAVIVSNALLSNEATSSLAIRLLRASQAYRVLIPRLGRLVFARCLASFLEHPLDAELETDLRCRFLQPATLSTVARVCRAYDVELPAALATLSSMKTPTLALWASHGLHFSIGHAWALQQSVRHAEVQTLQGAHWMAHEHAEDIAVRVVSFVARTIDA